MAVVGSGMEVEGITFPPTVRPPGSTKDFVLGGAGNSSIAFCVRGLEIQRKFVRFTSIGIYVEQSIIPYLALKWKEYSAEELKNSEDFFTDVITCPYEKLARVALIAPLTGKEYCEKVREGCRRAWESAGIYGEAEAKALEQFCYTLSPHTFPVGSSILFTVSPAGLAIAFSEDGSVVPAKAAAIIESRVLAEGVLASIIGKYGVSPAAKASLADRISNLYLSRSNHFVVTKTLGLIISGLEVEGITFPLKVTPPSSVKELVLGGAGFRGLEIEGKFIKFTTIGVYIEEAIISYLAFKWKDKTVEELNNSLPFFMDIVTCPFEKFIRIALVAPLTGIQYSDKVCEGCKAAWEAVGIYGKDEAKALEQFKEIFKEHNFLPGSSILFTISPKGLVIAFSKDDSIPKVAVAVIENRVLAEGVLASILGKNGVSPSAKFSLAQRISKLLKE